jgi:hypothetical protein
MHQEGAIVPHDPPRWVSSILRAGEVTKAATLPTPGAPWTMKPTFERHNLTLRSPGLGRWRTMPGCDAMPSRAAAHRNGSGSNRWLDGSPSSPIKPVANQGKNEQYP